MKQAINNRHIIEPETYVKNSRHKNVGECIGFVWQIHDFEFILQYLDQLRELSSMFLEIKSI
ncbi:hypothetical protein HanIR_Chr09g0431331 [Helianthus annuus]|nr:hypothetical protein HanIR_Chr09g0431331 [Helianthus annuus]